MTRRIVPGTALLCVFAMTLQASDSGKEITPAARARKNPVVYSVSVVAKARENFEDHCLPCHGEEGKGDGPLAKDLKTRPKDLTNSRELSTLTDGEIFWMITTGKDPMPSFAQKLTDEERWGLVYLVRKISGTTPHSTPHQAHYTK